jgi:hypothetical protein
MSQAQQLIGLIRADIEQAADSMLAAAEMGLRDLDAVRQGSGGALDRLERTLCAILEACAFQDLAGQRLSQLEAAVDAGTLIAPSGDPLLNGPAAPGEGLDQAAADALLEGGDPWAP